ncbi:MAG: spore maturation protein [Christensenellales bacterium]|jgi:spore maturation protein B
MSGYIIPAFVGLIVVIGMVRGVDVYEAFVEGASQGLKTAVNVLPYLTAMLLAVSVFRTAGGFSLIGQVLAPVLQLVGIPADVLPMVLIKPFSGSAALSVLADIFQAAGPDSYSGILASVMMGSTETIFYTVTLYAGAVGLKDMRYTIAAALFSMIAGIVAAVLLCTFLFL